VSSESQGNVRLGTRPESTHAGTFHIVGVGSSAGGLEALQELVRNVPVGLPLAILVAQHLAPQHKSLLAELLGRQTALNVHVAEDGAEPHAGTVYVCPPNADLVIQDGVIRLHPPADAPGPRPSVDALLASLAAGFGEQSVGVILSGTGSDGAYGMRAIQAAGGLTIAQDPSTAKYASMPRAAIDAGIVDRIAAPAEIGELLTQLIAGDLDQLPDESAVPESLVKRILSSLHSQTGVDYSSYKDSTIRRQIARRMAVLQIADQSDYLTYLLSERAEARVLGQNMLVSVTSFYRDPAAWDNLSKVLGNDLTRAAEAEPLRLWVPGCATGEEAYTLAMIAARALGFPADLTGRLKVFATDLDDTALEIARRGIYPASAADRLPRDLRDHYTEVLGSNMVMKPQLKECVVFARHNLAVDPPFLRVDIVSCRNLLIYFEQELQDSVLRTLHFSLKPGGLLQLGTSEGVGYLSDEFPAVNPKQRLYRRGRTPVDPPRLSGLSTPRPRSQVPLNHSARSDENQVLRDSLLRALAPPSLVVNENGNLVQVLGDVSRYCQFPEGDIDMSVTSLVRRGLLPEVRRLMAQVRASGVSTHGVPIKFDDGGPDVQVVVRPAASSLGAFLLVSFTDAAEPDDSAASLTPGSGADPVGLQAELDSTREALQSTIEELETSNEELQAMNEEMMASTEELQASNEELETINEELQASNEELGTLNEELQVRTRELADANLDLRNIQEAISQALILVDKDACVTRYSPLAVRLFALIEDDIGTRLDHIGTTVPLPQLRDTLRHVITAGTTEIITASGEDTDYQIVISAWRNESGEIGGAVLSINDITSTRASRRAAEQTDDDLVLISSQLGVAAWTRRRGDGALVSIGSEAANLLGVPPAELVKDPQSWVRNVLAEDLDTARRCADPDRPIRLQYRTLFNGQMRTIVDILHDSPGDVTAELVGTIRDVTEAARMLRHSTDSDAMVTATFAIPGQLTVFVDRTGEVLRTGAECEEYLGVPPELLVGRRLTELCVSSDRSALSRWLAGLTEKSEDSIEIGSVDRDGRIRKLVLNAASVALSHGTELLVTMRNVTAERAEREVLRRRNSVDNLTGLTSRSTFTTLLNSKVNQAKRDSTGLALLWLDLDGFKDINDRYGHAAGDEALAEVSARLRNAVRGFDTLARVGGDEFCLLVDDVRQLDQLDFVAERLLHSLRSPLDVGSATCHVTGSIGIALYPSDAANVEDLLLAADTAMYAAKAEGGDRFKFHLVGMQAQTEERARQRHDLAEAIRSEAFTMRYQPILDLADNRLFAAEALVRRRLSDGQLQEAGAFIETAEHSGQIRQLGRLVLKLVGNDLVGFDRPPAPLAVNMSPAELNDPSLPTFLRQTELLGLVPDLIIEVTEHLLLEPRSVGMQTLGHLRSMGARIWLDDYGTGFSNMSSLGQLEPEVLKIDRSFISQAAGGDSRGLAFLESARALGESLGCRVLAEGVEDERHLEVVLDSGINLIQGYLIGRPMPPSALTGWTSPLPSTLAATQDA